LFNRYDSVSSSGSNTSASIPSELRLCVSTKRGSLHFLRWLPRERRLEQNPNQRDTFDLIEPPRCMGLSRDHVCVAFRKSYVIMDLKTGLMVNELNFHMTQEPSITCLQDRTQWCLQMETSTIFFNANFEPIYDSAIIWKEVPSAIVQASPYVLALMNQSIDICTFNGSQSVPVQQILHRGSSSMTGKCRLWMDVRTKRIYAATLTDVVVLEPIPVHIQLHNYTGTYKYDLALILIRAVLGISVTSSVNDQPRTNDGHARRNLDLSVMPKEVIFSDQQISAMNVIFHVFCIYDK
jgi:hypothetical protein